MSHRRRRWITLLELESPRLCGEVSAGTACFRLTRRVRPNTLGWLMKRFGSFITGFIFLHALVATPLLVECSQADGRYLLEILGNDPCHNPGLEILPPGAAGSALICSGAADPCLDLLVENPCCTRICSDVPVTLQQTPDRLGQDTVPQITAADAAECRVVNPLPYLLRFDPAHSPLALRI